MKIISINTSPFIRYRLMELGFIPGIKVEIISKGSPIIFKIGGGRIVLSSEIAKQIIIEA